MTTTDACPQNNDKNFQYSNLGKDPWDHIRYETFGPPAQAQVAGLIAAGGLRQSKYSACADAASVAGTLGESAPPTSTSPSIKQSLGRDGSTTTTYNYGQGNWTVETSKRDGSANWVSGNSAGWTFWESVGPPPADATQKRAVNVTELDPSGDVFTRFADPHVLDELVDGKCVVEHNIGQTPAPCASVDNQSAVLKSRGEPSDVLTIPTQPTTGIEDPQLEKPGSPNYFLEAFKPEVTDLVKQFAVKDLISKNPGMTQEQAEKQLADEKIGVAVNSAGGRSQDRLHLHTDYIDPKVQATVENSLDKLDGSLQDIGLTVNGHPYKALWLPGGKDGQLDQDPFKLLASSGQNVDMARQTICLIPETRGSETGYAMLVGEYDPNNKYSGTAEELMIRPDWVLAPNL